MKGQPTEVLAGSGGSTPEAGDPEAGKPPTLKLKTQREESVFLEWQLEPRSGGGALGRSLSAERGGHRQFSGHCFMPPALMQENRKKFPNPSLLPL